MSLRLFDNLLLFIYNRTVGGDPAFHSGPFHSEKVASKERDHAVSPDSLTRSWMCIKSWSYLKDGCVDGYSFVKLIIYPIRDGKLEFERCIKS